MFCKICGTVLDPEMKCVNCLKESDKSSQVKEEELEELG